jgi:hypothetical protein
VPPILRVTFLASLVSLGLVEIASAHYNPRTGRFLNRDPVGEPGAVLVRHAAAPAAFMPRDAVRPGVRSVLVHPEFRGDDELHGYRAVRNDPVAWVDPDGAWAVRIPPCNPAYPPPNPPPGKEYDCVGLACRDFSAGRSPDDLLEKFRVGLLDCSASCKPCEVKCWQWNYKLDVYSPAGQHVGTGTVGHIVCGQVGCNGEEPNCYNKMTKYGKLEGPKPCASFKPPESGDPIEIGPANTAKGFYVKRSDFEEHCYCGPVVPPSSLPEQK